MANHYGYREEQEASARADEGRRLARLARTYPQQGFGVQPVFDVVDLVGEGR